MVSVVPGGKGSPFGEGGRHRQDRSGRMGVQQGETRLRAKVSLGERALCAKGRVGGTKRVPEILVPGREGRLGGPRTWAHPVGSEPSVGLNKGAV